MNIYKGEKDVARRKSDQKIKFLRLRAESLMTFCANNSFLGGPLGKNTGAFDTQIHTIYFLKYSWIKFELVIFSYSHHLYQTYENYDFTYSKGEVLVLKFRWSEFDNSSCY